MDFKTIQLWIVTKYFLNISWFYFTTLLEIKLKQTLHKNILINNVLDTIDVSLQNVIFLLLYCLAEWFQSMLYACTQVLGRKVLVELGNGHQRSIAETVSKWLPIKIYKEQYVLNSLLFLKTNHTKLKLVKDYRYTILILLLYNNFNKTTTNRRIVMYF